MNNMLILMAVVVNIVSPRADEKPIEVTQTQSVVAENAFFERVKTAWTFTNPNARVMEGEVEFPLPPDAFVCGYALEVNGEMYPGVVCEKEKARVAFENEVRKGVDPGLVEKVKGNVWKTRIFPLNPKTPRKAEVEFIVPKKNPAVGKWIYERDGDAIFVGTTGIEVEMPETKEEQISGFTQGLILWDVSGSAKAFAPTWLKQLDGLPAEGNWKLIPFHIRTEEPKTFTKKAELLAYINTLAYDGGTRLDVAKACIPRDDFDVLIFSDEEPDKTFVNYPVHIWELTPGEMIPEGAEVKEGRLLATVWASRQGDLSLELARKYGVAGDNYSLLVLDTLDQWLTHKIEPPKSLSIHAEWVKRRAADDDVIAAKKEKAAFEERLLHYWEERVKWWNNPIPPKRTPQSGLFDGVQQERDNGVMPWALDEEIILEESDDEESVPAPQARAAGFRFLSAESAPAPVAMGRSAKARGDAGSGVAPKVTVKAWDPKAPYLDALKSAPTGTAYAVYLKERTAYETSPAFFLDCAGWFFKAGETATAERVISNLTEFKLEDPALWRTMGWRLREAQSYDFAVFAFRHVLELRGEEGQSRRDLALVLAEQGKALFAKGDKKGASRALTESLQLFADAAFTGYARRSARRGNDFQVAVISLEELNGLIAWVNAQTWDAGDKPIIPTFDAAYRRDLPVKLRIVMSWDADQTDIDLHVLEPDGEEAFYGHRRTSTGGFVSEDVTTGYGPEEYLRKDLKEGTYKLLTNYFASHQTALTGATCVTATVYTDWGTAEEKMQVLTLRLDKPKEKCTIGEVQL